jgi:hypothetical protein
VESLHREFLVREILIQERSHWISVFQLFRVREIEEVVVMVLRVSSCGLGTESFKLLVRETTKASGPSIPEDMWQRSEVIRVSDTRRLKDQEFGHGGFTKLQILKCQRVHMVEVSGKSLKRDFGSLVTRKTRGKSYELLAHKTLKGSEPLDKERL